MSDLYKRIDNSQKACSVIARPVYTYDRIEALEKRNRELESRVAMLEDFVVDAQLDALQALDPDWVPKEVEAAMSSLLERCKTITHESDPDDIEPNAFIKRVQAEAVDECYKGIELLFKLFELNKGEIAGLKMAIQHCKNEAHNLRAEASQLEDEKS